jgi:hypothetical protein
MISQGNLAILRRLTCRRLSRVVWPTLFTLSVRVRSIASPSVAPPVGCPLDAIAAARAPGCLSSFSFFFSQALAAASRSKVWAWLNIPTPASCILIWARHFVRPPLFDLIGVIDPMGRPACYKLQGRCYTVAIAGADGILWRQTVLNSASRRVA